MIAGARRLPIQHLSIRVPWHDSGWDGTVCAKPGSNTACRSLARIAESKDDTAENEVAGSAFAELATAKLPPCVDERAGFMALVPLTLTKRHPYVERNPDSHGHFAPTPYTTQPFSAACIPFRWMLTKECPELAERYGLAFQPDREPDLRFSTAWIQERANQLVMLDTFFGAVRPEESLCFFYAKDTPLSSSGARVIVGVGLVRSVGEHVEYEYTTPIQQAPLRGVLWERNVEHSIRPGFEDGFLFPYSQLFDLAMEQGLDPEQFVAFAPDEAFGSFSYTSEHVSHDHAIASVLACMRALDRTSEVLEGPWRRTKAWLDGQLNRLWQMRGPFPGFGSALTAFLGEGGNLVAYELAEQSANGQQEGNVDPWPQFEQNMRAPNLAEGAFKEIVGEGFERAWLAMLPEQKALLKLLSRFAISAEQAKRFFDPDQRPGSASTKELLANPYRIYELDRELLDAVTVETIDRGMLPDRVVLKAHPLPEESRLEDKVDPRRVRALMVAALENAAENGHTLQPRGWITRAIGEMSLDTDCPAGPEVLAGLGELLLGVVTQSELADASAGYQLQRFAKTGELLRKTVQKRVGPKSKRHSGTAGWRAVVDTILEELPEDAEDREAEEKARTEKAAALEEIFASRLSVLIGAAGTGKTTLLKMLCSLDAVSAGGILLLAPTGKARVQLEKKTGIAGGMTIAQFLMRFGGRYVGETGQYRITGHANRCSDYKTVIVDECSMLTEEQLAALLDGVSGVDRLVLAGDPRQLPPIGTGRPFVDIVRELEPEGLDHTFPRVSRGYAELTIPRRQRGATRADLLLAGWFGGSDDPSADEIWDRLESEKMDEIRFISWADEDELQDKLLDLVVEELELSGREDEIGFESSIGGNEYKGRCYFRRVHGGEDSTKAEDWQVISPVRGGGAGSDALNKLLQRTFRKGWLESAAQQSFRKKLNSPQGRHGIIYGDKVINLKNSDRRKVFPDRESYVANGDVGLVIGAYKSVKMKKLFKQLQVEFTSQPGFSYNYWTSEFSDEGSPPLELAYTLTVHKTQGSEFGTTFVVLPNPCWLLSRELLYTALTRQQKRVVILHQGDIRELRRFSREHYSDIARRLTNLFKAPSPVLFEVDGSERFLEEGLIHRTKRGDLVRSKSEVVVANELLAQGIDRYEYESPVTLSNGEIRYPDFTIVDDDSGERYYWEHLGLLNNPDYAARWERKLRAYRAADILPHAEGGGSAGTLIITRDDEAGGIDAKAIAKLVTEVLVP